MSINKCIRKRKYLLLYVIAYVYRELYSSLFNLITFTMYVIKTVYTYDRPNYTKRIYCGIQKGSNLKT